MSHARFHTSGFTIVEVLVSALLIALSMGTILSLNLQSISALRSSHAVAASSQILQQRIELIRRKSWAEISSSTGLARVLSTPAESEGELADPAFVEAVTVSVPQASSSGPAESTSLFILRRTGGVGVEVETPGDLSAQPTLFVDETVSWRDRGGTHQRTLRSIVCRAGLTRSGLYGSVLGRPGTGVSP